MNLFDFDSKRKGPVKMNIMEMLKIILFFRMRPQVYNYVSHSLALKALKGMADRRNILLCI